MYWKQGKHQRLILPSHSFLAIGRGLRKGRKIWRRRSEWRDIMGFSLIRSARPFQFQHSSSLPALGGKNGLINSLELITHDHLGISAFLAPDPHIFLVHRWHVQCNIVFQASLIGTTSLVQHFIHNANSAFYLSPLSRPPYRHCIQLVFNEP